VAISPALSKLTIALDSPLAGGIIVRCMPGFQESARAEVKSCFSVRFAWPANRSRITLLAMAQAICSDSDKGELICA
jgi:hypothetical protein